MKQRQENIDRLLARVVHGIYPHLLIVWVEPSELLAHSRAGSFRLESKVPLQYRALTDRRTYALHFARHYQVCEQNTWRPIKLFVTCEARIKDVSDAMAKHLLHLAQTAARTQPRGRLLHLHDAERRFRRMNTQH